MSRENRGRRSGSVGARLERKRLAPYPPWEEWRHSLEKRLKQEGLGESINNSAEPYLQRMYVLRRRKQLGEDVDLAIQDYVEELDQNHPEIFSDPSVIFSFRYIGEKTSNQG